MNEKSEKQNQTSHMKIMSKNWGYEGMVTVVAKRELR